MKSFTGPVEGVVKNENSLQIKPKWLLNPKTNYAYY